jgi:membrane fusion protein (multidrug efflux system)
MDATGTATSGASATAPKPTHAAQNKADRPAVDLLPASPTRTGVSSTDEATVLPRRTRGGRPVLLALAAGVGLGAALYGGWRWWDHSRCWVTTDNAYVAAHVHTVSARVAGTVAEVLVEENQVVPLGALIARLDPGEFQVRRRQAEAQVAQAQAQRRQALAKVAEAQAQTARESARAGKSRLDLGRAAALYEGASSTISKQDLDQAQAESDAGEAVLKAAQAAVVSAEALVLAAEAQERAALANLEDARLQLSYTELRAPAAGRIGRKHLEVGNRVQPGQALVALVQPEVWVNANFKETQLARLKSGQAVAIRLDAYPGRVFAGTIESLAPATGAQFALLPPDNATGNFTRIVQRVPVKIVFPAQALGGWAGRIVPGLSAVVEVKIRG